MIDPQIIKPLVVFIISPLINLGINKFLAKTDFTPRLIVGIVIMK